MLEVVADTHGIVLKLGSGTFTPGHATFKLEISTVGESGEVNTKEADDFKRCAHLYGLKPEHLGQTFFQGGREFVVVGCKPRSSSYPILAKNAINGKTYKLSAKDVARVFNWTESGKT